MSSNGFFSHQRNAHSNTNGGTMLKRRIDNRSFGGDFQEDRIRYAQPQKRARTQTHGNIPLYHHHDCKVSRVSNYGDVNFSNSINSFTLHNNDVSQFNTDYQKPYGYGNPNLKSVPFPLPYRNLDDDLSFDSLPEWVPNWSIFPIESPDLVPNTNRDITGDRFKALVPSQTLAFTNYHNTMPMNNANMISIVSQTMEQQPIVTKTLSDLLGVLNNKKEKQISSNTDNKYPLGLSFEGVNLNVQHESVISSLNSDMPRQCASCGIRFKCQEYHSKHMDWHVKKNRMAKDINKTTTRFSLKPKTKSQDWFVSSSLYLSVVIGGAAEAAGPSFHVNGETQKEKEKVEQHTVRADENQKTCALCLESFEEFYSHEDEEWMYKDAVYLNKNDLGPIVHAKCMP